MSTNATAAVFHCATWCSPEHDTDQSPAAATTTGYSRSIDDGLRNVADTGEAWYEAELHRLRGEAFALSDPRDPQAVASMRQAVEVATAQGSENLRLRAESSLARLVAG